MPEYMKWELPMLEKELESAVLKKKEVDKWVAEVSHAISVKQIQNIRDVGASQSAPDLPPAA